LARIPFTAIAPSGNQTEITIVPAKFIGPNESPLPAETFGGLVQVDGIGTNSLVVGVIFSDEDADGHKEDGELGLYREVRLTSGSFFRSDGTRGDGSYLITGGTPGNYTLQAMLNELVGGICSDGPGSFDPLWHIGCTSGIEIEWEATTPQPVSVLLEPGVVARVDFGARRRDQQSVRGGALLRTGHAPNGTLVQAWANNTLCGEAATATVGSNYNFIVEVMGNRERPGCANDGDIVTFTVDGAAASQTLLWGSEPAYSEIDLIAIPDHAWLWVEQPAPLEPSSVGTAVVAIVDGKACATMTIARTNQGFMPGPPPIGFTQLAVPSDTLAPGCGAAGKVVSFRIGVEMSAFTTTWQPGLHRIDLPLPGMGKAGDDDCNGAVDAGDALGILRWVATQGYFGVDCRIPTDVNCDGSRSAVDALHILRFVAGLPSRVPEGCPGVGA
jgi:hypothetical protein